MEKYILEEVDNLCPSKEKNILIESAIGKYEYLVIKNKHLKMDNDHLVDLYISKMNKYNVGCMFYPYSRNLGNVNRAFGRPCPVIEITVTENQSEQFSRSDMEDFIILDLKLDDLPRFNENLEAMSFQMFLKDCHDKNLIPFFGIYLDIYESWKYFSNTLPEYNMKMYYNKKNRDMAYINKNDFKFSPENNLDEVIKYVALKNNMEV